MHYTDKTGVEVLISSIGCTNTHDFA